jgi:hypothetical protein
MCGHECKPSGCRVLTFSIDASSDELHTRLGRGLHSEVMGAKAGAWGKHLTSFQTPWYKRHQDMHMTVFQFWQAQTFCVPVRARAT